MKPGLGCVAFLVLAVPALAAPDHLFPEDGMMSAAMGRHPAIGDSVAVFGEEFAASGIDVEKPAARLLAYMQIGPFPPAMVALEILPNGRNPGSRIEQFENRDASLRYRIAGARVQYADPSRMWNYDPRRTERLDRCEAAISPDRALRLAAAWDKVLFQTRHGSPTEMLPIYPDGGMYSFAAHLPRGRLVTGWTGAASGNAAHLIEAARRMMAICEREGDANAHWKTIEREIALIR